MTFTKEAIQQLAESESISAADTAVTSKVEAMVALPTTYTLHDLEKQQGVRRRPRGVMNTSSVESFVAYAGAHREEGASVFVDADSMRAVAVLNLGVPVEPGHADNLAIYAPKRTAAYDSLVDIAKGQSLQQIVVAEFFEDWAKELTFARDGVDMAHGLAVAAARNITIEALSKVGAAAEQLSESRTSFEQVKATGDRPLPTSIKFKCIPYQGLSERTFELRLGINTGGPKPMLTLRVVKFETHVEEMAEELVQIVNRAFAIDSALPIVLGTYVPKP